MPTYISGTTGVSKVQPGVVTPAALSQPMTLGAVVTAVGNNVDLPSIPAWARKITLMFSSVSTAGASNWLIQPGTSAGPKTSGFIGSAAGLQDSSPITAGAYATGIGIRSGNAVNALSGQFQLTCMDTATNKWVFTGMLGTAAGGIVWCGAGEVSLPGALDRLRLTTVPGNEAYDGGGTVAYLYEG